MTYTIDMASGTIVATDGSGERKLPLYSKAGFELISHLWLKVGWDQKYTYTFSWMGRPIIQLPDDLIRFQEVVHAVRPDVIVETGIAHGGSLVYSATLCKTLGRGRVIGVDIEIRPHNRRAIETHPLADLLTLVEGDSTAPEVVDAVRRHVHEGETVLVVLDSNHSRDHVLGELEAYAPLVSVGSYLIATDGVMQDVADTPRGQSSWMSDNPVAAVNAFLERHPEFIVEQAPWPFNESGLEQNVTHWPRAYLRRVP